jgi:hypothetical protein
METVDISGVKYTQDRFSYSLNGHTYTDAIVIPESEYNAIPQSKIERLKYKRSEINQTRYSKDKFGINCCNLEWNRTPSSKTDTDTQLLLASQLGVKWLRLPFYMGLTEMEKDKWTLDTYDYIIDKALSYDFKILGLMCQYGSPPWSNGGYDAWKDFGRPALPEFYASWCQTIAERYKKINMFELGNEPDMNGFWKPNYDVVAYTELMKAGYTAIKSSRPETTLLTAGLMGGINSNINYHCASDEFLQGIYDNGGKDYFDGLGLHLYRDDGSKTPTFNTFDRCRKIMNYHGDNDKLIYITEIGHPTGSSSKSVDEATQASYLNQYYAEITTGNHREVPFLMWFNLKDTGNDLTDSEQNYGLVRNDKNSKPYEKKQSYTTYQQLAKI